MNYFFIINETFFRVYLSTQVSMYDGEDDIVCMTEIDSWQIYSVEIQL